MRVRWWVSIGALALCYVGAAKVGIDLPVSHGVITPVWIPTGLSIAAVVLLGFGVWPAVAIGALVANWTSGVGPAVAAGIAVGNTAEALLAGYLLRRAGFRPSIARVRDVVALVALGALVAPAVSATNGVTVLLAAGDLPAGSFGSEWLLWWFGDAMGAVLVAPALLVWGDLVRTTKRLAHPVEAAIVAAALIAVSAWVFLGGRWQYPYLLFPLLVWAALRFKQVGAATAMVVVGAIAVWGTVDGSVPIGGVTRTQSVQILQALLAVVAVATLLIGATLAERESGEERISGLLDELSRRERLNVTLLGAVSDLGEGFLVTDSGRLTYANEAYCQMTGYTLEELMAFPTLIELSPPEDREELVQRLRSRLAGGAVEDHYEASLVRKDGRIVFVEVAVKLMQSEEGPRLVSIVRDVSERRRMEIFREEFLAYAAHELRGPIATIRGFTDLLRNRRKLQEQDVDRAVERIEANAETMAVRFERLMGLARVQRGGLDVRPTVVSVLDVVRVATSEVPVPEGRALDVDVPEDLSVHTDRHAAEQILSNLLTNAYRYGGPHVRISAAPRDGRVELSVADDGEGVPADLLSRLFEPFAQGPESKESGGAGLGLAMVRALGETCGIETGYAPAEPNGARFHVSFPPA